VPDRDWQQLLAAVHAYGARHLPSYVSAELRYRISGCEKPAVIPLPVPCGAAAPADVGTEEQAILKALERCDPNDPPTGEQLANLAGYSFTGRFRETLAELVRQGTIVNHRPGYTLP
jgi:hypothetical protein